MTRTITIKIPDELYDELLFCRKNINSKIDEMFINAPRITLSSIVRDAIEIYLKEYNK